MLWDSVMRNLYLNVEFGVEYCGDEECGICNVLCDCCGMSDVENDAMCCNVRCGGVMRCGIWCGVEYDVV